MRASAALARSRWRATSGLTLSTGSAGAFRSSFSEMASSCPSVESDLARRHHRSSMKPADDAHVALEKVLEVPRP